MISIGPTGNLVHGDVLDVNRTSFDRALRDLDDLLYTSWNPTKLRGHGCWEIRRRPITKTAVKVGILNGITYYDLQYVEANFANHIKDCAFLNYDVIRYLKTIDTYNSKNWVNDLENSEQEHREKVREYALKERSYAAKQIKSQIRGFKELLLSGTNPAELARHWDKKGPK